MPSKYDTNPLDPDFPEKVKAETETRVLGDAPPETRRFAEPGEEQTRRFSVAATSQYSGPFTAGIYPSTGYSQSFASQMDSSSSRKVAKVGLPENVLTAVPYIPWYIGLVAGVLILLLVPKSENKVRFHAAQGLAAHLGILIVTTILGIIGSVANVANVGSLIFNLVTSIMLVVFAIKAWRGKPVHIESVDSLTNWLEEKVPVVNN